jgi:histone H1/5
MTDRRGHRAHWSAALIIAPGAAAVFGASTSWAMQVTPPAMATAKASAQPAAATPVASSRAFLAPRRAVAARERQLVALRVRVKGLQRQLSALAKPLPSDSARAGGSTQAAAAAPAGGSGGGGGKPAQARWAPGPARNAPRAAAQSGSAPRAAAPRAAAPRAAAPRAVAPPVHSVTGAS